MNKLQKFLVSILSLLLVINIGQIIILKCLIYEVSSSLKLFDEIGIYQEKILKSAIDISKLVSENEKTIKQLSILKQNTEKITNAISKIRDKNREILYYENEIDKTDKEVADKVKNEMIKVVDDLNYEMREISQTTNKINKITDNVIEKENNFCVQQKGR